MVECFLRPVTRVNANRERGHGDGPPRDGPGCDGHSFARLREENDAARNGSRLQTAINRVIESLGLAASYHRLAGRGSLARNPEGT